MSAVIVDSAEQGGNGCVSVFWAEGVLPSFGPLGTVD